MELRVINGKEIWYAMPRNYLTKEDPATICARYTTEIRGLYQYYRIADNISFAGSKFGYIMRYSFCKTLAKKLNSSTAKVIRKYRRDHDLAIPYQAKKGETKFRILYNDGFARQEPDKERKPAIIYLTRLYFLSPLLRRDSWSTNVNCVEQPMSRP